MNNMADMSNRLLGNLIFRQVFYEQTGRLPTDWERNLGRYLVQGQVRVYNPAAGLVEVHAAAAVAVECLALIKNARK